MQVLQKELKIESLLHVAQLFIYTITADILLSEIAFILGRSISWYILPFSFLAGLLCLVCLYGEEPGRQMIYEVAAAILLFVFFTVFCGRVFDFSWDGNAYHKVAVGLLRNHWNPIFQLPENVTAEVMRTGPVGNIWAECYAKGTWIFAAGVYGLTGNIECGKVYTLIGIVCAFLLTYYCVRSCKRGKVSALFFSAVAACNPIALQQMNSFYLDGYLHIMLYILVLSLVMMVGLEKENRTTKIIFSSILACAMVICGTIKFTGLLYGGIYCIAYFLYYCYCQLRASDPKRWRNVGKCFGYFALLAAVTVLWAGADTYVINTIRHGSPVYPLYGEGAVDIVTWNSAFGEVNRVKNLLISLFSKVGNPFFSSGGSPQLKIPFTVDWSSELYYTHLPDSRVSGFGVFFSGLLMIAAASIIIKIIKTALQKKSEKDVKIPFWAVILVTNIGLCLTITESWWARYAPYIYFTVLMGAFFIWDYDAGAKGQKIKKCISVLLFILFLGNNLICLFGTKDDLQRSAVIRTEMQSLKSYAAVEIDTDFSGVYFNLKDQGIYYTPNKNLKSSGIGTPLSYMGTQILFE